MGRAVAAGFLYCCRWLIPFLKKSLQLIHVLVFIHSTTKASTAVVTVVVLVCK